MVFLVNVARMYWFRTLKCAIFGNSLIQQLSSIHYLHNDESWKTCVSAIPDVDDVNVYFLPERIQWERKRFWSSLSSHFMVTLVELPKIDDTCVDDASVNVKLALLFDTEVIFELIAYSFILNNKDFVHKKKPFLLETQLRAYHQAIQFRLDSPKLSIEL